MAKYTAKKAPGVSRDALRRAELRREREKASEGAKRSASSGDKNVISIHEPAARLQGGPRDGWVYYISDLEQAQRAAERMGGEFDYRPTRRHCVLPWTDGVKGTVWVHRDAM